MDNLEPQTKYDALLEAALKLFTTEGFQAATSKIAQEAGVATGTLFHHFESKEALINELYLSIKKDMAKALSANLKDQNSVRTNLEQLWLNTIHWILGHRSEYQFLTQHNHTKEISKLTRQQALAETAFMSALAERGKREKVLKDLPTELLGTLHSALIQAEARYFLDHPSRFKNVQQRNQAFQAHWDAIRR